VRVLGVWFATMAAYARLVPGDEESAMAINSQVSATQDKLLVGFYLALAFYSAWCCRPHRALCYGPERS